MFRPSGGLSHSLWFKSHLVSSSIMLELHTLQVAGTHYFVVWMSQVTSYSLALLKLMEEIYESTRQLPLGIARCVGDQLGVESLTFDLLAHKILLALIIHTQSPENIAKELLIELGKCRKGLVETLGLLFRWFDFLLLRWWDVGFRLIRLAD